MKHAEQPIQLEKDLLGTKARSISFHEICKLAKDFMYPIIPLRPITKTANYNTCDKVANIVLFTPDMKEKRGRRTSSINRKSTFLRIKISPSLSH